VPLRGSYFLTLQSYLGDIFFGDCVVVSGAEIHYLEMPLLDRAVFEKSVEVLDDLILADRALQMYDHRIQFGIVIVMDRHSTPHSTAACDGAKKLHF